MQSRRDADSPDGALARERRPVLPGGLHTGTTPRSGARGRTSQFRDGARLGTYPTGQSGTRVREHHQHGWGTRGTSPYPATGPAFPPGFRLPPSGGEGQRRAVAAGVDEIQDEAAFGVPVG